MKKSVVLSIVLALMISLTLVGCPEKETNPEEMTGKLVIWSFTNEVEGMGDYFKEAYPLVELEFVEIPMGDEAYQNKLTQAMRAKASTPDVFTGEVSYVKRFASNGWWENLSQEPYNAEEYAKDMTQYVVDLGRDTDGNIAGLSWQACPGGLFYRRDIAKEIWGTDDPDWISANITKDMDTLIAAGKEIVEKSGGKYKLVSGYSDFYNFYKYNRDRPWVVDNKFVVDQHMIEWFDIAKEIREADITLKANTWSPAWFGSMEAGDVFCYILPTWGLHYVLKPNAEPENNENGGPYDGNWGLASPPYSYSWGGTWIGVSKYSANKELGWEFVKYITCNEDFIKAYALKTGDFMANAKVVDMIKDQFSESFLAGQNHYAYFAEEAKKVDTTTVDMNDDVFDNALGAQVALYVDGAKTLDEAIADWKAEIQAKFPDLIIE